MIVHVFNSSIVSGPEMLVLPALTKLGTKVSIIFLTEMRLEEESKSPIAYAKSLGHDVHSVPVRGRWDRVAFKELREVIDRLSPQIVHAHDVKASLYLLKAKQAAPNFRPLIVSTHHGASYRKGKIRLYEEFYVRRILPHFDRVLSVCELDRESIQRRGVDKDKLEIHLNGTDRTRVELKDRTEAKEAIRRRWKEKAPNLPNPSEAIFLGAVARLSPEKRHDRMLKVLSYLRKSKNQGLKPILLCFGTGAEERKLKRLAHAFGVEDAVFWMGYSNTISQEMAGFDVLLSLSDGEGIPINLLEAGWAATPVMATQVGGIPDLIPTQQHGFLVQKKESDESIARELSSKLEKPESLNQVGKAFQDRVTSQFSEAAWLNKLREVYGKLGAEIQV